MQCPSAVFSRETPAALEAVSVSDQSNERISIRVARPEARRACESLDPFAKLPTPIANTLSMPLCT